MTPQRIGGMGFGRPRPLATVTGGDTRRAETDISFGGFPISAPVYMGMLCIIQQIDF
jgi:hypothetical protein